MRLAFTASILIAVSVFQPVAGATLQSDAKLAERFRIEAPSAWERYRERAKRFQGSVEIRWYRNQPEPVLTVHQRYEIEQRDAEYRVTHFEFEPPRDTTRVAIRANGCNFTVQRANVAGAWVIVGIDREPSLGKAWPFYSPSEEVERYTTFPICLRAIQTIYLGDPALAVKGISAFQENGEDLVRVEFEYMPHKENPRSAILRGWIVLDPSHFWVLRTYELEVDWDEKGAARAVGQYTYKIEEDGLPILTQHVRKYVQLHKQGSGEHVFDFSLHEDDVPASRFTIGAFELPNPLEYERTHSSGNSYWLWTALVGGACILIGVAVRWWARRGTA